MVIGRKRQILKTMGIALMCISPFSVSAQDGPPDSVPPEYEELIRTSEVVRERPVQTSLAQVILESTIPEHPSSEDYIGLLCSYIKNQGYVSEDGKSFYLYDIHTVPAEILLTWSPGEETLKYLSGKRNNEEDGTASVQACSVTYHIDTGKADPVECIRHSDDEDSTVYYSHLFNIHTYQQISVLPFTESHKSTLEGPLNQLLNTVLRESVKDLNDWFIHTAEETQVLCLNELGFYRYDDPALERICTFVNHAYESCLARSPDRPGSIYWVTSLYREETSPGDMLIEMLQSPEFLLRDLSSRDFVITLYEAFLHREPDAESLAEWIHMLDNGITRNAVIEGFSQSAEFYALLSQK